MNFGLLFFQFLPLVLYIAVDYWKGFKAGILAAIGSSLFLVLWNYSTTGDVDQFSLGEAFLIVVLGIISLKMNNERFFKFQPTVVAILMAGVLLYFEVTGESLLVRYIPHMERLFAGGEAPSGEVQMFLDNLHTPEVRHLFTRLSRVLIVLFLGHAAIMAHAALFWSTARWFAWRLAIYPALLATVMLVKLFS